MLGVVGNQYVPIQNEDHTELLNTLVDQSGAHFETAGSLNDGKNVFVTMKMPETMQVGGSDGVDTYISALNNHDGSAAFKLLITPVRIVCANTQTAAIKAAKASFGIRHTKSGPACIEQARQALGLTFKYIDGFQAEAERLINEEMTVDQFVKMMDSLVGVPDLNNMNRTTKATIQARDDLLHCFLDSPTVQNIKGTRWAGYQAVTEWTDHMFPVRGDDKDIKRALRTATGGNDAMKLKAWNQLVAA